LLRDRCFLNVKVGASTLRGKFRCCSPLGANDRWINKVGRDRHSVSIFDKWWTTERLGVAVRLVVCERCLYTSDVTIDIKQQYDSIVCSFDVSVASPWGSCVTIADLVKSLTDSILGGPWHIHEVVRTERVWPPCCFQAIPFILCQKKSLTGTGHHRQQHKRQHDRVW